jgi:hypothetical protein
LTISIYLSLCIFFIWVEYWGLITGPCTC